MPHDAPETDTRPLTRDAEFHIPDRPNIGDTGASQIARVLLDLLRQRGHDVQQQRYVEEELVDEHGHSTWTSQAMRVECAIDGRRVVMRFDHTGAGPDCWTVTVDGQPQEIRSLWRLQGSEIWAEVTFAVHQAFRRF